MSEHQELLAALALIAQGQNHIIKAIESLGSVERSVERSVIAPSTLDEHISGSTLVDETPAPEVNNPTNPAHAVKHDEPTPSEDDLKKALMEYSKKTSREQAKALLERYDSKKVSDVPEAMRAMLIQQMEG